MTAWPCACSGDRYCAVPMIEPVSVISDAPARAMPKSVTLAWPLSSTITLCGLKSRWITPRLCAKPAAWRICRPRSITRSWPSGASAVTISLRVRPAQVLHRDVVGALVLAAVEDADDVRVLEPGGGEASRRKRSTNSWSCAKRRWSTLSATCAAELGVLGAVDVRHPRRSRYGAHPVAAVDERVVGHPVIRRLRSSASSTLFAIGAATVAARPLAARSSPPPPSAGSRRARSR